MLKFTLGTFGAIGELDETLDVIVPLYNDEEVVRPLCEAVFQNIGDKFSSLRLILVDDGSEDRSFKLAMEEKERESRIEVIRLASNFGQHRAISAGLKFAQADYVAIMDSDLQDNPADIPLLIEKMKSEDKMMSIARRNSRKDHLFKKVFSRIFSIFSNALVPFKIDSRLGSFRVINRSLVSQLNQVEESTGTPFSLLYYMNIEFSTIDVDRGSRVAGSSSYNLRKSIKLAMDRILTYSIKPMRVSVIIGILSGVASLAIGLYTILNFTIQNKVAPGWTSIAFMTSFFGGMNLLFLGIIGEYTGRIYLESRGIPRYMVRSNTINESEE